MELKSYQKAVMRDLSAYLSILDEYNNIDKAWRHFWREKDIAVGMNGVPGYNEDIKGVPHICMKVPTGGGKTFMACASVKRIFDEMPKSKPKVVVWLVPSDPILVQTIKNLSDPDHPYRQRLNADFSGRVGVYTKEMLLNGQNFSPDIVANQLTVCILSYGSLRIDSTKKDVRKVYQENGNLLNFAQYFKDDKALLAGTPDTALIQVLRHLSPVVIVDESHNAGSKLSVEMLENLSPSFILDLTATPRKNSNILSYVDPRELKKENMVKLPVIVYNRKSAVNVINDAIQLRNALEAQAQDEEGSGGRYIRPIVLFQAQPKTSSNSKTFDKIKEKLVEKGIPEEQIAIKVDKIDDIGTTDLMSRDCPIRYIITVNALKEGWDCPFAYILATIANKTSKVDVEQILGRILRQPYAKKHGKGILNTSFVLTCSNDFRSTLENVVKGLNGAGFSRRDYRVGEDEFPILPPEPVQTPAKPEPLPIKPPEDDDPLSGLDLENIQPVNTDAAEVEPVSGKISQMISRAEQEAENYEEQAQQQDEYGYIGGELGDMLHQYHIQPQYADDVKSIKIPQFMLKTTPNLFGNDTVYLQKDSLLDGFSLESQNADINFTISTGEMYSVDIQTQGEGVPKYKRVSQSESEYLHDLFARLAPEQKIESCTRQICHIINKDNAFSAAEIEKYVRRAISNMTEDELAAMETSLFIYAKKIKDKIDSLKDEYREKRFYKWLDSGKIVCEDNYIFPDVITPSDANDSVPMSLYEAEAEGLMNELEKKMRDLFATVDGVLWWHRIIDRKGFCINGAIHHYPDFIVKMKSGRILLIETKGDDRDNSNSVRKLKLGKSWASCAGERYRYFMVFDKSPIEGAYPFDEFAEIFGEM